MEKNSGGHKKFCFFKQNVCAKFQKFWLENKKNRILGRDPP